MDFFAKKDYGSKEVTQGMQFTETAEAIEMRPICVVIKNYRPYQSMHDFRCIGVLFSLFTGHLLI